LPNPFGRRQIGLIERVFRRIARAHGDARSLRKEDHNAHLEHLGKLERGGPQKIVERENARELAAEQIEVLGGRSALPRRQGLRAHARRQIARDQRDNGEEEQRDDVSGSAIVKV